MDGPLFTSATGEWTTPDDLFEQLNIEFNFTLDAAATEDNALCTTHLGPGSTICEDALASNCSWAVATSAIGGEVVWCNPPYGRGVGRWVAKAIHEALQGTLVVMLLPARTDTKWFHAAVEAGAEVRLIKGRLKFGNCDAAAPFPSCLLIFRPYIDGPYTWITL